MRSQRTGRIGRTALFLTLLALVVALALPTLALAQPPGPDMPPGAAHFTPSFNPPLGKVPVRGSAAPGHQLRSNSNNLLYHFGPTMHTNTVYAIYWVPAGFTVSANYISLINGFFGNVAAAGGATTNVYYSDTQYYDNVNGNILDKSTLGGSYVDTNALPASGCSDPYTTVCLTDAQIQTEINSAITQNHWATGPNTLFFMFTARGIGSCSGGSCAFSQYCAYHSWAGSGSSVMLYANMPYADTVPAACDAGQHPNGDDADATINVTSHEHNEAITDEQGSAWYDRRGSENGDKCAWNFGASLGSTSVGQYNQAIGTGKYYLQQEWSNRSSGCVLTGQ
ncbi:MAG TPA: hypothetical protein VGA61_14930 [Anaerolineae bacterium]